MIYKGKYLVPPSRGEQDFKQLFKRLASAGAGRPVDEHGIPKGAWTPELLARAISEITNNPDGVDTRTVQHWFQENDKGISADNIQHLARIFGADEPMAVSAWQAELTEANWRLAMRRKENRRADKKAHVDVTSSQQQVLAEGHSHDEPFGLREMRTGTGLIGIVDRMFSDSGTLNLPIAIWSGSGLLWFLTYIIGIHSITYSPLPGLVKQVGYFWSVSWNIGEMLILPVFLLLVVRQLHYWKAVGRPMLMGRDGTFCWIEKLRCFRASLWVIAVVCAVAVFLLQWVGVYLLPLLNAGKIINMVDWALVAKFRADIVSTDEAIGVSLVGFLYSGFIYWLYFNGVLLLYVMADDFNAVSSERGLATQAVGATVVEGIAYRLVYATFAGCILGIFIAVFLKLNAAYLVSSAPTMTAWLLNDAAGWNLHADERWTWLRGSPSPFFTSFLLLFISCFVFLASIVLILSGCFRMIGAVQAFASLRAKSLKMALVVVLLAASYLMIGQFHGFSLFLAVGTAAAIAALVFCHPSGEQGKAYPLSSDGSTSSGRTLLPPPKTVTKDHI